MSSLLAKVNAADGPLNAAMSESGTLEFLGRAALPPVACATVAIDAAQTFVKGLVTLQENCNEIDCEDCNDTSLCDAVTIITS